MSAGKEVNCWGMRTGAMFIAQRADPAALRLPAGSPALLAGFQGMLYRYIHCSLAIPVATIVEKMQLAEFGFDLGNGDGGDLGVPLKVRLQRIAKRQQDSPPARITVDVLDGGVKKKQRLSLPELFDGDFG
jgi:hypothetical protein